MKKAVFTFMSFFVGSFALAANVELGAVDLASLKVHYGVYSPEGESRGDVLFLHGYGDTFENHQMLFEEMSAAGLRVIGFDYPSHGKTEGSPQDDLDLQTFDSLTVIAHSILAAKSDPARPLVIAGWSTGGLHAIRIAQKPAMRALFPNLKGLILFAPGVAVKKCVGNAVCEITNDTLVHEASLQAREIKPKSPLLRLDFATRLLFNAWKSWHQPIPPEIPTLVFVGSKDDQYVKTNKVKDWVFSQRKVFHSRIQAYQCPQAFHELDNEPREYGGAFVRSKAVSFASSLTGRATQQTMRVSDSTCIEF